MLHRLSEQVYQKAARRGQAANGAGAAEETVEDAEYEVIDEEKEAS